LEAKKKAAAEELEAKKKAAAEELEAQKKAAIEALPTKGKPASFFYRNSPNVDPSLEQMQFVWDNNPLYSRDPHTILY
jgi:hypothetical protein